MKIKNVETKNNIFLAPMAGVTDVGFRKVCSKFGAGLTYTEMISAKGLLYNPEKTSFYLNTTETENPVAVQIFGSEPEVMAQACKHPLLQKFDIIDINMGCPVKKIVNNNEGSSLMTNMTLAYNIINACVNATDKPITVKFRIGFDNENINAVEFAKMCEKAGASAITIHGRTRAQMYSGSVNYDIIKKVKESVKIPVIGNGDIVDKESYQKMLSTGVDGVMIGRGSMGCPWIFSILQNKDVKFSIKEVIKEHIDTYLKFNNEKFVLLEMKKHFAWYLKNIKNNKEIKSKIMLENNLQNIIKLINDFLDN